jgi:hypothetical protein
MTEYRARTSPSSSHTHPTPLPAKKIGLSKLAQRYNIGDMMEFSQIDNPQADQTVDEEFLAYTNAASWPKNLPNADILSFWEVSSHYLLRALPDFMPCTTEK